jgi:hypothetical protein
MHGYLIKFMKKKTFLNRTKVFEKEQQKKNRKHKI